MAHHWHRPDWGDITDWPERGPAFEIALVRRRQIRGEQPKSRSDHYVRIYRNTLGPMTLSVGKEAHLLSAGDVAVVGPETVFSYTVPWPVDHWYMHLSIKAPWSLRAGLWLLKAGDLSSCLPYFKAMEEENAHRVGLSLNTLAGALLLNLPTDVWFCAPRDPVVTKTLEVFREHRDRPPGNDVLASLFGLHEDSYIRHFRRVTGTTPQAMGLRIRLDHAATLLDETDRGIEEIARACGFLDRFHFSKAFTRRWKVPPARWRREREG